MSDIYQGREQTETKHFLLRAYLYQFAFKLLSSPTVESIAYVDGFSGPWNSRDVEFKDTSFYIALSVLSEVKREIEARDNVNKTVFAYFVEKNETAFEDLQTEVLKWNEPKQRFHAQARCGRFEDFVPDIMSVVEDVFTLVFIDPTGWTGYPMNTIAPLLFPREREAIVNFMYDHTNRFGDLSDVSMR